MKGGYNVNLDITAKEGGGKTDITKIKKRVYLDKEDLANLSSVAKV